MMQLSKILALVLLPLTALADQWLPAMPQTYTSPNWEYRLTVYPRQIADPSSYFEGKVTKKPKPGQRPGAQSSCEAVLERVVANRFVEVWRKPLVNDVAPVSVILLDDARFVTFDNWHWRGFGDDVIVVYTSNGAVVRKLALTDLMPKSDIAKLPGSVSSIAWLREARISLERDNEIDLEVARKSDPTDRRDFKRLRLRLTDGAVLR